MTKTIKENIQYWQEAIKTAEKEIKALRKACKHIKTFEGIWSWRPGAMNPAEICNECGSLIKFLDNPNPLNIKYRKLSDEESQALEEAFIKKESNELNPYDYDGSQ